MYTSIFVIFIIYSWIAGKPTIIRTNQNGASFKTQRWHLHTEPIKYLATISTYILLHKENPFNVYILYLDNMRLIVNNFIIVNMFTR